MDSTFVKRYGPYAIVTGASEGIGRAVSVELARKGMNLILVARRGEKLEELKRQIQQASKVEVQVLSLDLTKSDSSQQLFDFASKFDVGLLASIAGFGTSGDFADLPIKSELEMIDLNCRVVVEQVHHFVGAFKSRKRGGIILMSSLVAFQGVPRASTYAATKAFIQSFAEGLHLELKSRGVDVLAAAPGPVLSGFASRAHMKMGKAETPEQIALNIVNALGEKATVRPGPLSKFLGWSLLTMPRWNRVKAMKKIMGEMSRGAAG